MKTRSITHESHNTVMKMMLKEYKNFVGDSYYATTGMYKLQQYRHVEKISPEKTPPED